MSQNATSNPHTLDEETLEGLIWKFVVYTIQGSLLSVVNLLVFFSILFQPILRRKKEYILIAGLAFTDALNGLACFFAGVGRNIMIFEGTANAIVSRWTCLWKIWNPLWIVWEVVYGPMLCAISVDRLIAVSTPLKYFKLDRSYAFILLSMVYGPAAVLAPIIIGSVYQIRHRTDRPAICYTGWVHQDWSAYLSDQISIWAASTSVVIYVLVWFIFRKKPVAAQSNAAQQRQLKTQRRLTVTLGISCLCTFSFHIVPLMIKNTLLLFNADNNSFTAVLFPLIFFIQNCNPCMNFFLYITRHKDLRNAVKCLIICKKMSPVAATSGGQSKHHQSSGKNEH